MPIGPTQAPEDSVGILPRITPVLDDPSTVETCGKKQRQDSLDVDRTVAEVEVVVVLTVVVVEL